MKIYIILSVPYSDGSGIVNLEGAFKGQVKAYALVSKLYLENPYRQPLEIREVDLI